MEGISSQLAAIAMNVLCCCYYTIAKSVFKGVALLALQIGKWQNLQRLMDPAVHLLLLLVFHTKRNTKKGCVSSRHGIFLFITTPVLSVCEYFGMACNGDALLSL